MTRPIPPTPPWDWHTWRSRSATRWTTSGNPRRCSMLATCRSGGSGITGRASRSISKTPTGIPSSSTSTPTLPSGPRTRRPWRPPNPYPLARKHGRGASPPFRSLPPEIVAPAKPALERASVPNAHRKPEETRRGASPPFRSLPPGIVAPAKPALERASVPNAHRKPEETRRGASPPFRILPPGIVAPAKPALERASVPNAHRKLEEGAGSPSSLSLGQLLHFLLRQALDAVEQGLHLSFGSVVCQDQFPGFRPVHDVGDPVVEARGSAPRDGEPAEPHAFLALDFREWLPAGLHTSCPLVEMVTRPPRRTADAPCSMLARMDHLGGR